MPRITKEQMKKDEEKVIKMLSIKANESIDAIAKKCGFSRQKAWRIIKRLEQNNTIWGYNAVVDVESLGLKNFILLIKAAVQPQKAVADKIINRDAVNLAKKIGIHVCKSSYLHGPYDWLIVFSAIDIKQAKKFTHILCKTYPDYLVEATILEEIFPITQCGFLNPNINKLKEFETID